MPAELPSTEQIFTETSHLVPLRNSRFGRKYCWTVMSSLVLHVLTDHKWILKADEVQIAGLPTVYNVFRAFEDDDNSPVIRSLDRSRNVDRGHRRFRFDGGASVIEWLVRKLYFFIGPELTYPKLTNLFHSASKLILWHNELDFVRMKLCLLRRWRERINLRVRCCAAYPQSPQAVYLATSIALSHKYISLIWIFMLYEAEESTTCEPKLNL